MQCRACGQHNLPEAVFCGRCGNTLVATVEPLSVIGVGSSYGHGWRQLWKHFLMLFLIGIIGAFISSPSSIMGNIAQEAGAPWAAVLGIFSFAYGIFLAAPITYGSSFVFLKAARDDPPQIPDTFAAFHNYWNAIFASLLVGIIVVFGFLMLIVPGIIFACRLSFTPYLVVDRRMQVIEAVQESWHMTRGHAGTVFLIGLLGVPICIAGLICCGVGIIISIMWISLAQASLYHAVTTSGRTAAQEGELVT